MRFALRTLLGLIVAMALAFVLVVAVEGFSQAVYPFPGGDMREHVRRYPHWILAVVVLFWGVTAAGATWVAARVGNRVAGTIVALLLAWALVFNLAMLPYTTWFKVVMPCALVFACLLGIRHGKRRP